jgi:hypothetical protein
VVEHLPYKYKALSLNPVYTKEKKRGKKIKRKQALMGLN